MPGFFYVWREQRASRERWKVGRRLVRTAYLWYTDGLQILFMMTVSERPPAAPVYWPLTG